MRGAARIATYLGRVMIGVGLVLLFLGWNFAANWDCLQCQFPYLLSGSIPGVSLVIAGLALEYVQTTRELTARRAREHADLDAAMSRLLGFVRDGGALVGGPGAVSADGAALSATEMPTAPPPSDHDLSALDASSRAFAPAPTRTLVAGRSSFHDSTCHLVSSRQDMAPITREEAQARGLAPCRICKP